MNFLDILFDAHEIFSRLLTDLMTVLSNWSYYLGTFLEMPILEYAYLMIMQMTQTIFVLKFV